MQDLYVVQVGLVCWEQVYAKSSVEAAEIACLRHVRDQHHETRFFRVTVHFLPLRSQLDCSKQVETQDFELTINSTIDVREA